MAGLRMTNRSIFGRRGRKSRGFTLVELIVVLTIIALLAAVGVATALGFINRSKFDQNSQNAITVYQTAQSVLSEKSMNGTMDEWVSGLASFKGQLFDPTLEAKLLEDKETNRSINKTIALTYNPKSATNPEDKYLYELLRGSFYDMTVFNGTMAVELDISATYGNGKINYSARVLSAFYSRENDIASGWDDIRKGDGYDQNDPELKNLPQAKGSDGYVYRRRTSYVGWFNGTSESVTAPSGVLPVFLPQSKVQPLEGHIVAGEQNGYLFNLRNGETLDVAWAIFDYDGTARKNHNENIVITLNSAEKGHGTEVIRGNDTSDTKFYDGVQICISPEALSEFLSSVEHNPSTTVKENVNGIYDITRTSQDGFIKAKVVRTENNVEKTYTDKYFPLTVTLVKGDGRKGTARDAAGNLADYYEFRLSLDAMMVRADETTSDPGWNHYGIDRLFGYTRQEDINRLNPRNIYATLHGSWNNFKANGSYDYVTVDPFDPTEAARAIDDPVYLTNVRQTNGVMTYIYYVEFNSGLGRYDELDSTNSENGNVITGRCVVNSLFGDLNYSNSYDPADADAISGTFWSSSGGNAVITSYRHLYNIRKVFAEKTATFRIVKNLDWYVHDTVMVNGTITELYTSEVKVFSQGTAGYKSPVDANQLKVVSFPALRELKAKHTLTSVSDSSKKIYWINNIQMRGASFRGSDNAYGFICINNGTVYNLYTNNLNLVMKDVPDGSTSDYDLINPDGNVTFDTSANLFYNGSTDKPLGGLIGKSTGKIGVDGIESRYNTVQMCNTVVMGGNYWNGANHARVAALVAFCENSNANATDIYGVLELKGSFFIVNGGTRTGGLIADNYTNVAAKLVVDGSPVSQDNEFSNKPVETHSGKPVSCFIGGRGYVAAAFAWSNGRALTYGTAINADDISYDTTTGKLSFPDMENNFQIDVDLPESSLILQSPLNNSTWKDPCGIGSAVGVMWKYSGDFLNIRVNNDGDILTLDGSAHNVGCGGAIGYIRDIPSSKNIFIETNNGSHSRIGSPDENGTKYAGGAVGFVDGTKAECNFVLDVTNDGSINAAGNGDYQGVGGAVGAAGANYVGRSLVNVVNKENSSIEWQGNDKNSGYGAGGAIGSLGKVFNDKANPSESNLITSDSVIYVNNAGSISGASNVGGAIGFAPRNDGRIYTENSGTIEGTGGIGFVGGSVGRMLFAQRGTIQSILNGATIIGSDFVGGAAGRILNFRMDVSAPAAVVRTVVTGNSTVKSDSGSIVGGVAGDLFVQGNGNAGSVELVGHSSVPKLTVFGWDAVGGTVGAYRSDSGNYPQVVMPDQAVTNKLIVDVDGDDYVGGAVGLLRPSSDYSNSTSNVINLNLKTADISIVIDEVLHPQSSIVGSGVDVGGAIGYISSAQKMFKGRISVSSIAGDNSGGSLISGSRNVGGAIGCDLLSCPYLAEGGSDNYGIIVDFSTSPWIIEATVSSDSEANVGGAVGYFNNGSNGDETSTYITNIQYYSKTGYNEKQSGYRNNVFPITVNMGSSSVIADGRNVGGAIGKSLIRTGNISVNDFSGTVSGKSNIGGAVGLNRSDFNSITVTILGSGTVIGGTDSDINYDDLASPVDYDGSNVGGAVGYNISRSAVGITVNVSGTIEGYGRNAGGAIGFCHFSESKTFINEINVYLLGNARVIGHSSNVVGSLGYTLGNINNVTTEIRGTSQIIGDQRVGGVIGFASAKLKNTSTLEGEMGSTVRDSQVGYVGSATAVISADYAIKGTKLIGGVIGETGFKRYMSYGGATRNAYTSPYFGEVKAVINSASVFSADTGTDSDDDVMAGGIIGHLTDGMVDNVVLGGTGGVVHIDVPNRTYSNSVLVKANGRAVGGLIGQIGHDGLQQNVFVSKVTIEDNAPYLCVVSGNGSDMIGGWFGSANGSGGGIGKRSNVSGYNGNNRSSYEVNNVRVVYSEGSYVGALCGRMDLKSRNQNGSAGDRYINADVTINLDGAFILGKSAVGAVSGGIGYGRWDTGSITVNLNNYTNIGDINNNIPSDTRDYDPICYEAGGAFGNVYYDDFGFDGNKCTFSVPITVNIDSTSGISGLAESGDADTNSNAGVGGAFGTFKGILSQKCFVNVNTDNSVVSVYSEHTNVGGAYGVWVDGKTVGSDATKIYISTNASVETAGANACAGGFAGRILNTLSNSSIQLARADGTVTASGNNGMAGGFVGNLNAGTIKLCFTTSIVSNTSGYSTGGFVGTADAGSISNCYVGGHTYDGQYVAGESNVTGKDNVGGFVGETTANVTFNQCYSTASVLGTGNGVGGFIGNMANNGKITTVYCTGRVINSSGNYASTGAFAGSVAAVNDSRFADGSGKVLNYVNDPSLRLVGSVGGAAVDENNYKKKIYATDYNGIHGDNTYTGYPFDKVLLANPDAVSTVYPLRAFINNTHYGDWPLPYSDGISLDSSSINITLTVPGVEYQKSGNTLPENSLVITYTNPDTQQSLQLVEGTHYTLSYADNINVGTAKVYISAVNGSGFKGSVVKTFEITPVNISAAKVVLINDEYYFNGAPIDLTNSDLTVTLERADGKIETLETPKDYYITYVHEKDGVGEHTGIGKVTGTIHGTNNYTGDAAATFTFNIIGTDISNIEDVELIYNSNIYTGSAIIPKVSVRVNGERLVQAADNDPNNPGDYILTYENCVNVGTGTAKVTVTGINNYSGDVSKTFDILPATDTWKTAPAIADWTYGSPSDPVGEATSGYPITYKYYLDSSLQTLTTPENSGASEEGGKPTNVGQYYVQARVERMPNGNSVEGGQQYYNFTELAPVVKNFTISKADLSGAEVTFGSSYYRGHIDEHVIPDDITVTLNGTELIKDKDFEVIYPESTAEPGMYPITINGIGNYEGTIGGKQYEIVRYYYIDFVTGVDDIQIEQQDIQAGEYASEPVNPREGYTLVWYLDEECEYPYDFNVAVDKNITLYAKWTQDEDPNNGNDNPDDPNDPNDPNDPGTGNEDPNDPNDPGTDNEDPNNQNEPETGG